MDSGALTFLVFITKSRELPSNGSFQKELLFSDGLPLWTNYHWEMCPYELGGDGGGGGSNKYAGTLSSGISLTVFSLECSCMIEKASALDSGEFGNAEKSFLVVLEAANLVDSSSLPTVP